MIAECRDGRDRLHLIIYHRDDNVYYVPDEENRIRQKMWEEQRWTYIMERRLQEEEQCSDCLF